MEQMSLSSEGNDASATSSALSNSNKVTLTNSSQTEIKVEFLKHHWTVKNFSHCYQEYLENFVHLPRGDETLSWSIKIYPKGNGENNKDFVFLCLNRLVNQSGKSNKIGFRSRFFLRSSDNKDIEMRVHPNPSHSDYVSYIKRDVLFPQIQPSDSITVFVEIDVAVETVTTSLADLIPPSVDDERSLSKNLLTLLDGERHADFTIRCGNKDFKVHKAILAARSPMMSAMFDHDSIEECQTGIMTIKDLEPNVIKEMLKFIYSGVYSEDMDVAEDLLIAADKYRLDDLKQHCERTLVKGITFDNACNLLVLGDVYSAKNLKDTAVKFIQRHPRDSTSTESWEQLVRSHPQIVTDIVRSFDKHTSSSIGPDKGNACTNNLLNTPPHL